MPRPRLLRELPVLLSLLLLLSEYPPMLLANDPVLLYPKNTVFQFTIGMSVPIAMDKKGGLVFSSGFQFNYALPWNLTQLEPMVVQGRAQSSSSSSSSQLNLENIYTSLENLLERHGWNDGRQCLLRSICELAEAPLDGSQGAERDVVEEIIHLLLTRPSEDTPPGDYPSQWSAATSSPYARAERVGSSGSSSGSCDLAYAGCAESPLESFTEIAFR